AAINVERNVIEDCAIAEAANKMIYFDYGFAVGVHALKKKIPVNTAFITNIASKACTTEVVVACPTPSAPPSPFRPPFHAILIIIHAKTTLLIIPEYQSHASALSSARST